MESTDRRRVVDKYEYNIKADQIMKLIDRRDFKTAAKVADGIDWRRVRNINMLTNVGCVYQAVGRYADAKEIFQLARNRAPLGRRLVYQMADVCIDAGEFEEAERYIQEFSELAPKDTARFELLYQLSRRKGEPIESQIAILEELKNQDLDERWSFELAKLYHKAGYNQKCVAACDELILWFGEGQYVDKAMELKMLHAPLSPSQQEKYNIHLKKKQEEENQQKEQKETVTVTASASGSQKRHHDRMYATDNLQAALTKSVQEIMEAEECQKASYPSERSYFEEYQSEQEERDAMFAATRDLRREREKFKNMMTQPISSLIGDRSLSKDSFTQNVPMQPYPNNGAGENFEQAEEETRRVFGAAENAFGGLEEVRAAFGMSEEEVGTPVGLEGEAAFYTAEETAETGQDTETFQEESNSLFAAGKKAGRVSESIWQETGAVFGAGRKERPLQTADIYSDDSKIQGVEKDKDDFKGKKELQTQENFEKEREKEDVTENLEGEESEEIEVEEEEDAEFLDGNFFGGEFYYQVPEEEPEYIEASFSLSKLDTNEVPIEVYYRIPDYDPQPFLNKMADLAEKSEEAEEAVEEKKEDEYIAEENKDKKEQLNSEEVLEENLEEDLEEDLEYEEFPEGGTKEEFYQYIMTRSYGVEEMPEDVSYQAEGYQENQTKEKVEQVSSKEDFGYIYGVEMMPEDAYYEAAGYNPESFLLGRMGNRGLEEEILGKKPKVSNKTSKKNVSKQISENSSEKKTTMETEAKPEKKSEIRKKTEQKKKEEPPLELTEEWKGIFANYLYMPGVEQQIAEILYETQQIGEEAETSMFGNILLMGEVKSGKTTLAVSLIKTMNRLNGRKGRKIAKISGDRLNNKGIKESISRLVGADLIIEHAGEMRMATVTELLEAMGDYTGGMIVVLEDTRTSIERLLADVPQIGVCFTHRIELKECNIAEWAETAKNYALENHYIVDDMAMLALSAKIDAVYANKKNIVMEDVQDIIDDAIEKAEKRNRKLFGRLFSKKKDSDAVLLRESDFN